MYMYIYIYMCVCVCVCVCVCRLRWEYLKWKKIQWMYFLFMTLPQRIVSFPLFMINNIKGIYNILKIFSDEAFYNCLTYSENGLNHKS